VRELSAISNRASFFGNCRLETGAGWAGADRAEILGKKRRLESIAVLCFHGVTAISNRVCRYWKTASHFYGGEGAGRGAGCESVVHASLLLLVRVFMRLHKVAMHDNTEGMGRISTHSASLATRIQRWLHRIEVKSGSGTDTRQMVE
jgi:hypothetical protein